MSYVPLIVLGTGVQAGGFAWTLREAAVTRRMEMPERPTLHRRAWEKLARRVERALAWAKLRAPPTHELNVSGGGSVRFSGGVSLRVRRGGLSTEDRFDALEDEVQEHREQTRTELSALDRSIKGLDESVTAATVQREAERRERVDRALTNEEAAGWMFAVGLLLTVVGTFA